MGRKSEKYLGKTTEKYLGKTTERYLGKTIKLAEFGKFRTPYGYTGYSRFEAYINDILAGWGRTKAKALKEAKKVLKRMKKNEGVIKNKR